MPLREYTINRVNARGLLGNGENKRAKDHMEVEASKRQAGRQRTGRGRDRVQRSNTLDKVAQTVCHMV